MQTQASGSGASGSGKKGSGGLVRILVAAVVLCAIGFGGMLGYKQFEKAGASEEQLETMVSAIRRVNAHAEHHDELVMLLRESHDKAFDAAYDTGGVTSPSEFVEQQYFDALFPLMRAAAQGEALSAAVTELGRRYKAFDAPTGESRLPIPGPGRPGDAAGGRGGS